MQNGQSGQANLKDTVRSPVAVAVVIALILVGVALAPRAGHLIVGVGVFQIVIGLTAALVCLHALRFGGVLAAVTFLQVVLQALRARNGTDPAASHEIGPNLIGVLWALPFAVAATIALIPRARARVAGVRRAGPRSRLIVAAGVVASLGVLTGLVALGLAYDLEGYSGEGGYEVADPNRAGSAVLVVALGIAVASAVAIRFRRRLGAVLAATASILGLGGPAVAAVLWGDSVPVGASILWLPAGLLLASSSALAAVAGRRRPLPGSSRLELRPQ